MGSALGAKVGGMAVAVGDGGWVVGETGVGVRKLQEARSRLKLKSEA
jgi:hypothetical protein